MAVSGFTISNNQGNEFMLSGRSSSWGPQIFLDDAGVCYTRTGPNKVSYNQNAYVFVLHLTADSKWRRAVNSDRMSSADLSPGAIDIIPSFSQLSATWTGEMCGVRVDIDPVRFHRLAGLEMGNDSFTLHPPKFGFVDRRLHSLSLWIERELQCAESFSNEMLDAFVTAYSIHVLRRYSSLAQPRTTARGGLTPVALRKVKEFVYANRTHSITVEQLAAVTNLSPSHFIRTFKQTTGQSPYNFVMGARLNYARELILKGDLPLSMIAITAGFASHSHMTAQMKRAWQTTPSQLRRSR